MFRIAVAFVLFVSSSTVLFAQQDKNLFPGDPGQTLVDDANTAFGGVQRAAGNAVQQVNQAAQRTAGVAKNAAQETANSLSRVGESPQSSASGINTLSPTSMIARWNQSTKEFFGKTKKTLSPPSFEKPKMSLPRPKGRVRKFFGEFTSRSSKPGTKKRGFMPSIFAKRPEAPPKPQTVQDFLGLDRPE